MIDSNSLYMHAAPPSPFFSIVVPLYNKEKHIGRTLRSALAQTFANFEIIVVDDGSRDGSVRVVSSFSDHRIILVQRPNGGVSAARNAGIEAARGSWIAFLDADDWYHPQHLAVLAEVISSHDGAQVAASCFRTIPEEHLSTFEGWPLMRDAPLSQLINDLPARWMHSTPFFTSSIAVKRSHLLAQQPCFPIGESHGEDLDLWFRLAELGPIAYSPIPTVGRTWVAGSLSEQGSGEVSIPRFLGRIRERARTGCMPSHLRVSSLRFYNEQMLTLARQACAKGNRRSAMAILGGADADIRSPRWWVTLLMVYGMPARAVSQFQRWRTLRRMDFH